MVRTLVGYSVLAVIGLLALKLVLWLLGAAFSLVMSLLWLAAIGLLLYYALRILSPDTADRLKEAIRGKRDPND
jgi:hypothetical protein